MKKDIRILIWGVGISWLTYWFLIIPISIIAIIITIYKLAIRKSKLTKYAILLSPFLLLPIINVGLGIIDYTSGNAKIRLNGYPSLESTIINREYRIEYKYIGCIKTGKEFLTAFPYNQTVKFLIKKFGYQKNSYTGIMPTKKEAIYFLSNGKDENGKAEIVDENKIKITVNSKIYQIDLTEQSGLILKTIKESPIKPNPKLKIVDDCLICRLNDNWIYLIELKKNKIIAQYRI